MCRSCIRVTSEMAVLWVSQLRDQRDVAQSVVDRWEGVNTPKAHRLVDAAVDEINALSARIVALGGAA